MDHPARRQPLVAVLLALTLVLAGCRLAAPEPSPTPADFPGITRVLGPLGITVDTVVSGDAGCDDRELARTAISFRASGLDQAEPVPLHLYRFHDETALQEHLGEVATCARAYVADADRLEQIVAGPYVLIGEGPWAERFGATLSQGLERAAAGGAALPLRRA